MFRREPQTATEWLVRLRAGPLHESDRKALTLWLAADPRRVRELEEISAVSQAAEGLAGSALARSYLGADPDAISGRAPRRHSGLRFVLPSLVTATAALLLIVFLSHDPSGLPNLRNNDDAHTAIGEISRYRLPDSSEITVAANSSVSVDFTQDWREMSLDRGEAFFEVQPDKARPFVVRVGDRTVTVTGTKFNVNSYAPNEMEVAVVEGRINVTYRSSLNERDEVEQIGAGEVLLFPANGEVARRNLTPEQVAAWRTRKLYFDSANLGQVLTAVNRYAAKPLIAENGDVEKLMLTGQFQAGDVQSVLLALRQLYGIEAREMSTQWLLVPRTAGRTRPGN